MLDFSETFRNENCRLDNLPLEIKKITAADNGCKFYMQKHLYEDGGWHNLRAYLINRVEQLTNYRLIVTWDKDEANPNFQIQDRKQYLKEQYGIGD